MQRWSGIVRICLVKVTLPPLEGGQSGDHIGRFSKDHGDFSHHYFDNLDDALRMFILLREA